MPVPPGPILPEPQDDPTAAPSVPARAGRSPLVVPPVVADPLLGDRTGIAEVVRALRTSRAGVLPRLEDVLALGTAGELAGKARDLKMAKTALNDMLGDIAEVEAMGETDAQEGMRKAGMIRKLYTILTGEATDGKSVDAMMVAIRAAREQIITAEESIRLLEMLRMRNERNDEVENAEAALAHIGALAEKEITALKGAMDRHSRAHAVRKNLRTEETKADAELALIDQEGEQTLAEQERAHLDTIGETARTVRELKARHAYEATIGGGVASGRLKRAGDELPAALDREAKLKEKENADHNKSHERIEALGPVAAAVSQMVSAYLNAQGFHGMSLHPEDPSSWVAPVGVALALNGGVYLGTLTYMKAKWNFRSSPLIAAGFAALVTGTIASGYAGMARETIPETVLADSITDRVDAIVDFTEMARGRIATQFNDPANDLVINVQKAGTAVYDEATGVGPSRVYGFRQDSIARWADYRLTVDTAARGLNDAGMCDELGRLDANYKELNDRLQAEKERNPKFAPDKTFVTVNASTGEKEYDTSFETQIDACETTNPKSPQELITSVDTRLAKIREGLSDGTIMDTPALNVELREMNVELKKLETWLNFDTSKLKDAAEKAATPTTNPGGAPTAPAADTAPTAPTEGEEAAAKKFEAPKLQELDPMFYESMGLLYDNTMNMIDNLSIENEEDKKPVSIKYPAMAVTMSILDQLGIIVAILILASRKAQKKENLDYVAGIGTFQAREKRAQGILERLRARFSPETK